MSETCSEYVCTTLKQKLEQDFALIICRSSSIWELTIDEEAPDQQTLLFKYPSHEEGIDYIQPFVRIEAGCRSDSWPTEQNIIKPFCAEYFPDIFDNERCPVTSLAATRTFWEKVTILHQEYLRPIDNAITDIK